MDRVTCGLAIARVVATDALQSGLIECKKVGVTCYCHQHLLNSNSLVTVNARVSHLCNGEERVL